MSRTNSFWNNLPPVTKNLLIINFICWLADVVLTNRMGIPIDRLFGLNYLASESFKLWQPLTYMFLHAGFDHIFFNMFAVLMFAPPLERTWGSRKFLTYYLVTGIGAAFVQELVWFLIYGNAAINHITIGASGAVFGVLFAFGWLFPQEKLFVFLIPIPIPARIFVMLYAVGELFFGIANVAGDNVAHFAHLGGMLFGWLLILWWKRRNGDSFNATTPYESKLKQWWNHRKEKKEKQKRENSRPTYHYQDPIKDDAGTKFDENQREIDAILDKIRKNGYSSLTEEERQKLFSRK